MDKPKTRDAKPPARPKTAAASLALTFWFALVALAFWGPYLGLPLRPAVATALYAVFLLIFAASGALRLVRRLEEARRVA